MSASGGNNEISALLRGLPRRRANAELNLQLHIAASKEAARRRIWANAPELLVRLRRRYEVWKANHMRPFALPCAGGLAAAMLVFTLFVQIHPVRAYSLLDDRPTGLYTPSAAKTLAPFEPPTADAEIEVLIDETGRVSDYWLIAANPGMDREVQRSVERTLLFTEFTPATSFGQRVPSRLRLTLRRGEAALLVKG